MSAADDPREALARNPFLVLGLAPGASRAEVEREGQRLLDALELGMAGADRYATPFGDRARGAEEIREALGELRDPERRAVHELFVSAADSPLRRSGAGARALAGGARGAGVEGAVIPPVGPLIVIAIWAIRAAARKGASAQPGTGRAGGAALAHPVPSWVWWYLVLGMGGLLVLGLTDRPAVRLLWSIPIALLWFPWSIARVLARLGWITGAQVFGGISYFALRLDRGGAGCLAASLALVARRRPDGAAAKRLAIRSRALRPPLRGAGVVARGLVAAARGHLEEARDLLRSVEHLPPAITPRPARGLARSWLAADAAARGDWVEVARLGRLRGPRPHDVRLLGACARRLLGEADAPGGVTLRAWWLLAPHRRSTRALLRRALATPPRGPGRPPDAAATGGTSLARAAALHACSLARHPLRSADLARLGRAWSAAFADPGTEQALLARELAMGADGRSDVLSRLARRVRAELAWLVRESGAHLGGLRGGPALEVAVADVRDGMLADLEAQAEALTLRARASEPLSVVEEWRAMARLRECYLAAVRRLGGADRRLAYEAVQTGLSAIAVHLFNERKERSIGHATFVFLAGEAEAVGDAGLAALHGKNARCGR